MKFKLETSATVDKSNFAQLDHAFRDYHDVAEHYDFTPDKKIPIVTDRAGHFPFSASYKTRQYFLCASVQDIEETPVMTKPVKRQLFVKFTTITAPNRMIKTVARRVAKCGFSLTNTRRRSQVRATSAENAFGELLAKAGASVISNENYLHRNPDL